MAISPCRPLRFTNLASLWAGRRGRFSRRRRRRRLGRSRSSWGSRRCFRRSGGRSGRRLWRRSRLGGRRRSLHSGGCRGRLGSLLWKWRVNPNNASDDRGDDDDQYDGPDDGVHGRSPPKSPCVSQNNAFAAAKQSNRVRHGGIADRRKVISGVHVSLADARGACQAGLSATMNQDGPS